MKRHAKRLLATMLSFALLFTNLPVMTAYAQSSGTGCTHMDGCGYSEGADCGHECGADCGDGGTDEPAAPTGTVTITAFAALDPAVTQQPVALGTVMEELNLPAVLTATVEQEDSEAEAEAPAIRPLLQTVP